MVKKNKQSNQKVLNNTLPVWNLGDLYSSINSRKILKDLKLIEKLSKSFSKKYEGKVIKLSAIKLLKAIEEIVNSNTIFIFIKGNKLMPQCGFSNNVVQIFNTLGATFETFDVLSDPEIREGIKEYSDWPTIPQVYINGEFAGGSDLMIEMYQNGELQQQVEIALAS